MMSYILLGVLFSVGTQTEKTVLCHICYLICVTIFVVQQQS